MQRVKPQKPYQSPEIPNEGNNSINNRKHAQKGRGFKLSVSSILAVLPLKLRENCWEAASFDQKSITVSLKACHKKCNLSVLYEMSPQRPSLTVDVSCERHHTPDDIGLEEK